MKNSLLLLCCAACLTLPASAKEKQSPLGKQMEALNDAFKAIRKEKDPAKGAALARDAQQAALRSLAEVPPMLDKMPKGPEREKATAEFHRMVGEVYVTTCEIEEAFLNRKIDRVAELAAKLKDLKKSGHDKFMEEDE